MKSVKVFALITSETYEAHQQILDQLRVTCTDDPQQCDVILLFCPIVSRSGSDVDTAVNQITAKDKPVVLILMYHTFKEEQFMDKTCWGEHYPILKHEVRVLFHQSQNGLLYCPNNQEAVETLRSICDSI